MRSSGWWVVLLVVIGCTEPSSDLAPPTETAPPAETAPAVLEPGYVYWPPLAKWRAPMGGPSCGSSASIIRPAPAIEILSSGGFSGSGTGNVQIWEDGTVMFDGAGCPRGSHRRGKIAPARVRAVLDKLEHAGFFEWPCDQGVRCNDSFMTSLTVHRGRAENTVFDSGCHDSPRALTQAIALVMQTVGKNACSPICRGSPAPDFCQ